MFFISRLRRKRTMTTLARARRSLQKASPYASLALLLVPLVLVEPLKLVAVVIAGRGYWIAGAGMLAIAYLGSLLIIERLFRVLKPKLMTLEWFAKLWTRFVNMRNKWTSDGKWKLHQ